MDSLKEIELLTTSSFLNGEGRVKNSTVGRNIKSVLLYVPGADPGFFLGGGEPPSNNVTDC